MSEPTSMLGRTAKGMDERVSALRQEATNESDPKLKQEKLDQANQLSTQSTLIRLLADEETSKNEAQRRKTLREEMESGLNVDIIKAFFRVLLGADLTNFVFDDARDSLDDSEVSGPEESLSDRIGQAQGISESGAMRVWEREQKTHASSGIKHISPVKGATQITSEFGLRNLSYAKASKNHKGLDFGARGGVAHPEIVATADGVVVFAGKKGGYGNAVVIRHYDGTYTLYGHMTGETMPRQGQTVEQGDTIGKMGSTGNSTATHLHYEQFRDGAKFDPVVNGQTWKKGQSPVAGILADGDHDPGHDHAGHDPVQKAQAQARAAVNPTAAKPAVAKAVVAAPKKATEPQGMDDRALAMARDAMQTATNLAGTVTAGFSTTAGSIFGKVSQVIRGA